MMFNGLLMCGDSDTTASDLPKEESKQSSCPMQSCCSEDGPTCEDAARALYYKQKFQSTLDVLRNKEETVRIQTESLAVAEQRIAALIARASRMRHEIDRRDQEIKELRGSLDARGAEANGLCACNSSDPTTQEGKLNHKEVIKTLQTNFSIIEGLYRKCFYESAKQEELIEMLRQSCIDVRQMELKRKDEVKRLRTVVETQRFSLDKCLDIAAEVDTLKTEITNFLHSSSNDSGMWEREDTISADVAEDLQEIATLLTQLQTVLATECSCALVERDEKEKIQNDIRSYECKIQELEDKLAENGRCLQKMQASHKDEIKDTICKYECMVRDLEAELSDKDRRIEQTQGLDKDQLCAFECKIQSLEEKIREKERRIQKLQASHKEELCTLERKIEYLVGKEQQMQASCKQELCALECKTQSLEEKIREKERIIQQLQASHKEELCAFEGKMECLEEKNKEHLKNINILKELLRNSEMVLQERTVEVSSLQKKRAEQDNMIYNMRQELERMQDELKQNTSVRCEVQQLSETVCRWRAQLAAAEKRASCLRDELLRARAHCKDLDTCYREKVAAAAALQEQLGEAQAQGAALCAEARRVVSAVRHWMRNMRLAHRTQKERIMELETWIAHLQKQIRESEQCEACCRLKLRMKICGTGTSPCSSSPPFSPSPCTPRPSTSPPSTPPSSTPAQYSLPRRCPSPLSLIMSPPAGPACCSSPPPGPVCSTPLRPATPCSSCGRRRPLPPDSNTSPPCKRCATDKSVFDRSPTRDQGSENYERIQRALSPDGLSSIDPTLLNVSERELSPGQQLLERVDLLQKVLEESQKRWLRGGHCGNR